MYRAGNTFLLFSRFARGKSNFQSIKKETAQKVKGSRNGHIQNAFDGLKWWDIQKSYTRYKQADERQFRLI